MSGSAKGISVHDSILQLLDYCGDIQRNHERALASAGTRYSAGYSPNNIRCLVISPNGVLVRYHIAGAQKTQYKSVKFQERDLYLEEDAPKYKPILHLLASPLVHASIEEIIILTTALSRQTHQNYLNEVRPEVLVETFNGSGSLQERVASRFYRLRYFTMIDVDFESFLSYFQKLTVSKQPCQFISEISALQSYMHITELAGKDYWRRNGASKLYYPLDDKLKEHFDTIAKKMEAKERDAAISEKRNERLGSKIKTANLAIEDYARYSRLWARFYTVVKQCGSNGVLADLSFVKRPDTPQIIRFEGMTKLAPEKFVIDSKIGDDKAIEENLRELGSYRLRCARELAVELVTGLNNVLDAGEPEMCELLMKDCETTVCVPPALSEMMNKIASVSNVKFDGRDIEASILNCCWQFIKFFVQYDDEKLVTREYWLRQLQDRR